MTLGAGIAAWKDLSFDPVSYAFLLATNLATSLHTVWISKVKRDTGLGVWPMLYYNHAITLPALFMVAWATGDLGRAASYPHLWSPSFQLSFQASVFLAFLLNLSSFYCTTLNSARTQTVIGQLKNFLAFLLGLLLFSDYKYQPLNFAGLSLGFVGSAWYTVVTAQEKGEAKEQGKQHDMTPPAVASSIVKASNGRTTTTITFRPRVDHDSELDPETGEGLGQLHSIDSPTPLSPTTRSRTNSASLRLPKGFTLN
jgi:hypothetical protein